ARAQSHPGDSAHHGAGAHPDHGARSEAGSPPADAPPADAATQEARVLFEKAVAEQRAGDKKEARQHYLEAFAKKPHYQIAANLGSCELELGMYRDAAEHLDFAFDGMKNAVPPVPGDDVGRVADLLQKASEQVVKL